MAEESATRTRTAVVVGGGIAGLTAALALRRGDWRVTVLESAPQFGEVGAGITLMANAMRALDTLGLGDKVRAAGHTATAGGTRTRSGRWLSRLDGAELVRRLGTSTVGIHRASLHRILRDALPAASLLTAARVEDVSAGPTATVTYRRHGETTTVSADLVVGADGINSTIRARLWPTTPSPVYSGSTAWRAVTPEPWPEPVPATVTWARGAEFGTVPLGGGRVYWYAAINAPSGQRFPDELEAVRERFGSWHAPIPDLLTSTPASAVLRHDLYHLDPPLATYVNGRVVLVGDAAHAMPPFLGQGGCQAIEDGVVLGWACAAATDPTDALTRYDRHRRPRSQRVARASARAGRAGQQLTSPAAIAVRDAVMRLTPDRLAIRAVAAVADWHPPQ